jgi:hypothetical protein
MTRDDMPPVPPGKVRLCEWRDVRQDMMRTITPLATGVAAVHRYPTATLAHETRGWADAGSCARWQEAHFSVLYWMEDGTRHGMRFQSEDKAREYFAKLTDTAKVSAMRQADAMLEDTIYRPAREAKARVAADLDARAAATTFKRAVALAHSLGVPVYRRDKSKRELLARIDSYTKQAA